MLLVTVFSFPGAGLVVSPEITSMERNSVSRLEKPEWDWRLDRTLELLTRKGAAYGRSRRRIVVTKKNMFILKCYYHLEDW